MRTKIRLTLNIIIQFLLVSFLFFQLITNPDEAVNHMYWFALLISVWQIIHAVYVVQKYHDWHHDVYLKNIKLITRVASWVLAGGSAFWGLTGGYFPSILLAMQWLGILLGLTISALAFQYFGRSIIYIYKYYTRPRSFWDL